MYRNVQNIKKIYILIGNFQLKEYVFNCLIKASRERNPFHETEIETKKPHTTTCKSTPRICEHIKHLYD